MEIFNFYQTHHEINFIIYLIIFLNQATQFYYKIELNINQRLIANSRLSLNIFHFFS